MSSLAGEITGCPEKLHFLLEGKGGRLKIKIFCHRFGGVGFLSIKRERGGMVWLVVGRFLAWSPRPDHASGYLAGSMPASGQYVAVPV
jgi:hypothetical protein